MEGFYLLYRETVYCEYCKNIASDHVPYPPYKCKRCNFEIVLCSRCERIRCSRCGGKMESTRDESTLY